MVPETTEVTTVVVTPEPIVEETVPETEVREVLETVTDLDHEQRITRMEERLNTVEQTLAGFAQATAEAIDVVSQDVVDAQATADVAVDIALAAEETADDAGQLAEVAVTETIEDSPQDDESTEDEMVPSSARKHPMFRSWDDWKNGR